ncbi:MAG: hypothetical protein ACETWD_02925 [Desulfatiglandales bacterium]
MGGRYGKYGEIKRFERLRKSRKGLSGGQGRPRFLKDVAGKFGSPRKRSHHPSLRDYSGRD